MFLMLLRLALTIFAAFILGKLVSKLRLPAIQMGIRDRGVCGGTSANIAGRVLHREVRTSLDFTDPLIPPIAYMQGVDLVTEGCLLYTSNDEERPKLEKYVINLEKGAVNAAIVGKSAYEIAKGAGLKVDPDTKILIARLEGVGPEYPLSREKLSPVLAYFVVNSEEEGITRAEQMVEFGGLGHSAVLLSLIHIWRTTGSWSIIRFRW